MRNAMSPLLLAIVFSVASALHSQTLNMAKLGVLPDTGKDSTAAVEVAIVRAKTLAHPVLLFQKGRYEFWPSSAAQRHYFISNHDVVDSRSVVFPLEDTQDLTIDGNGSTFVFHGQSMPFAIVRSQHTHLQHLIMDYATPRILQATVTHVENNIVDVYFDSTQSFKVEDSKLYILAEDYKAVASATLEFDASSKAVATGAKDDFHFDRASVTQTGSHTLRLSGMPALPQVGNILTFRRRDRPNPVIWINESIDVAVDDVTVRSAPGMALLGQRATNLTLNHFNVAKAPDSMRYFTTGADAVHCVSCRGTLTVQDGVYESMFDDALNVHSTYLQVTEIRSSGEILLAWMHKQTFGYTFASPGDHVAFVHADTLQPFGGGSVVAATAPDPYHVLLRVDSPQSHALHVGDVIDNTDWYPSVVYTHNTLRNNRARGTLIKTTRGSLIANNTYDHVQNAAVLFEADANNWFESAPARHIRIIGNTFHDVNLAGGPGGVISSKLSIKPGEASDWFALADIRISGNTFDVSEPSIIHLESVSSLTVSENRLVLNRDARALHPSSPVVNVEHGRCVTVESNQFTGDFTHPRIQLQDTALTTMQGDAEAHSSSSCMSQNGS